MPALPDQPSGPTYEIKRGQSGGADELGISSCKERGTLETQIDKFAQIEDPRCDWRVEHKLLDILVIAVCAVIGEAESFEDIALYGRCKRDWLGRFLDFPAEVPMWAVALGLSVSSGIGLLAGIYPAYRASRLVAADALRVE